MKRLFIFKDGTHKWVDVDGMPEQVTIPDYSAFHPVSVRFTKVQFNLGGHMTTCVYVEPGYEGCALDLILKAVFK